MDDEMRVVNRDRKDNVTCELSETRKTEIPLTDASQY